MSEEVRLLLAETSAESDLLEARLAGVPGFVVLKTEHNQDADRSGEEEQLLDCVAKNNIDVVLLSQDSFSVRLTEEIRQTQANTRIIVMTSSGSPEEIFAAMEAGADGYWLKSSSPSLLEMAIRTARLGAVWLDPGIARQVLQVIESPPSTASRILPTGFLPMPLMPHEKSLLTEVASSNCKDGVCLVDPAFLKKLKRFSNCSA